MIIIEIPPNPNCDAVDMRVFHESGPAQTVVQIYLERDAGHPIWYDVTGWAAAGTACPAIVQKIDDSGEGTAFLLYGGDGGLRFRPAESHAPWRIDDQTQWGESFMIINSIKELKLSSHSEEKT